MFTPSDKKQNTNKKAKREKMQITETMKEKKIILEIIHVLKRP